MNTYVRACVHMYCIDGVSILWYTAHISVAVSVSTLYGIQLWCVCASKSDTLPTCSACVPIYIVHTYVHAVPSVCVCVNMCCVLCVCAGTCWYDGATLHAHLQLCTSCANC